MRTMTTTRSGMTTRGVVKGLLAGLAGFLLGEYGAGVALTVLAGTGNREAVLQLAWLPWALAPLLAGVATGLVAGRGRTTPWWYWVAVGAVVPVGAYLVTLAYFASKGVPTDGLLASSAIQVVVSSGLALGMGTLRARTEEMAR